MFESLRAAFGWEPPANDADDGASDGTDEIESVDAEPAIIEMDEENEGEPSSNELTARINEIEGSIESLERFRDGLSTAFGGSDE